MFTVAWDQDESNPNPHAWVSDGIKHDTESEAENHALEVIQEGVREGYTEADAAPYIIIQL